MTPLWARVNAAMGGRALPALLGLGVVGLLLTAGWLGRRKAAEIGALTERLRLRDSTIATLAQRQARTDTVYLADTLRLRTVLNRYVTRRDTLKLTDTVAVREFIAAADTAIRACTVALRTCEQRVAERDTALQLEREQRRDEQRRHEFELARANPRLVPYAEAQVDPFHATTFTARAGIDLRLIGRVRATGALMYHSQTPRPFSVLVGARITF